MKETFLYKGGLLAVYLSSLLLSFIDAATPIVQFGGALIGLVVGVLVVYRHILKIRYYQKQLKEKGYDGK